MKRGGKTDISNRSTSLVVMPARSRTLGMARLGPMPMMRGARPTTEVATCLPRMRSLRPRDSALRRVMSSTAAPPSVICDALPPVVLAGCHCGNAGRTLPNVSGVEPVLIPSSSLMRTRSRGLGWPSSDLPLDCQTSMGSISALNAPVARARSAREWERAAKVSMASRVMLNSPATFSDVQPIGWMQSAEGPCCMMTSEKPPLGTPRSGLRRSSNQ